MPRDVDETRTHPTASLPAEAQSPSFESAFSRVIGPLAIQQLILAFTSQPVVLIAGDQLTGKSTAARSVAAALGGTAGGAGAVVRRLAEQRGLTVEAMSKALAHDPNTDVRVDFEAALLLARGEVTSFESRLAVHVGLFLRRLGREGLMTVYLTCEPKERALRYVAREVGSEARARIEPKLQVATGADLSTCLRALGAVDDADARAVAQRFREISERDDNDAKRLWALYGVDYRDSSKVDLIVDTTLRPAAEVRAIIIDAAARVRAPR